MPDDDLVVSPGMSTLSGFFDQSTNSTIRRQGGISKDPHIYDSIKRH